MQPSRQLAAQAAILTPLATEIGRLGSLPGPGSFARAPSKQALRHWIVALDKRWSREL